MSSHCSGQIPPEDNARYNDDNARSVSIFLVLHLLYLLVLMELFNPVEIRWVESGRGRLPLTSLEGKMGVVSCDVV